MGLGEQLGARLSRNKLTASGLNLYEMVTNNTLDFEMKTILQERDTVTYEFLLKIEFFTGEYSTTICLDQLSFSQYLKKTEIPNFAVCSR